MKIYHIRDVEGVMSRAVLVDRSTPWGNPFIMTIDTLEERNRVCDEFEEYATKRLKEDPNWLDPLVGKNLKCHCAPKRCHAETLKRLANKEGLDQFLGHGVKEA